MQFGYNYKVFACYTTTEVKKWAYCVRSPLLLPHVCFFLKIITILTFVITFSLNFYPLELHVNVVTPYIFCSALLLSFNSVRFILINFNCHVVVHCLSRPESIYSLLLMTLDYFQFGNILAHGSWNICARVL